MKWSDINTNPDDPRVTDYRRLRISQLKVVNIPSLREFLIRATNGAEIVVDVGYANHDPQTASTSGNWAHKVLREVYNKKLYGVDPVYISNCSQSCQHFTSTSELKKALYKDQIQRVSFVAMNVVEHVSSPSEFIRDLLQTSETLDLWLSTPNPSWVAHLYDWLNLTNVSTNVDHVALFGPSELIEIAERLNLEVIQWGFFGKDDMPRSFRPGPGLQRLFWWCFYSLCRLAKLPPAYNQVWIHLRLKQKTQV